MKNVMGIAFVFIGLVIGAGFASGREILQYFCIPSQTDLTGTVIAAISFGAICYITMHLAQKCNAPDFESFTKAVAGRASTAVKVFMLLFMFCGFFIMLSACGVLAKEVLGLSPIWGILLLGVVCFAVFIFETKGLVALNAVLVPLMIGGMLFICLSSMLSAAPAFSSLDKALTNPLTASLCYVSYNTVTAAAVLVPLSRSVGKKQILSASAICGAVLGLLIYIAWLCMNMKFTSLVNTEMPLLVLASGNGIITKIIYTSVLFMALCTTAVSHGFGILSEFKFTKPSRRVTVAALLCLSAVPFAGLGFSDLVADIYSAFGYAGFLWTGALLWKFLKTR